MIENGVIIMVLRNFISSPQCVGFLPMGYMKLRSGNELRIFRCAAQTAHFFIPYKCRAQDRSGAIKCGTSNWVIGQSYTHIASVREVCEKAGFRND